MILTAKDYKSCKHWKWSYAVDDKKDEVYEGSWCDLYQKYCLLEFGEECEDYEEKE